MEKPLLAFYGHHKCATTWIRSIIEIVCLYTGRKVQTFDNSKQFENDLLEYIKKKNLNFICYTNVTLKYVLPLGKILGFHIIRDPRDIINSAYFSHLHSHPTKGWSELEDHRAALKKLDKEEGLLRELDFSESVLRDMESWDYNQENVLEIKYEDFIHNTFEIMLSSFEHLQLIDLKRPTIRSKIMDIFNDINSYLHYNLKGVWFFRNTKKAIPAYKLLESIHSLRFASLAGRNRGEENVKSHYRKGESGDWKNHFTDKVSEKFNDKYKGLLEKLDYIDELK